jgi:hypothetical protein
VREILILDVTETKMFVDHWDRNIEILKRMRPQASELRHFGYPDETIKTAVEKFIIPVEHYTESFKLQHGFYQEDHTFFAVNPAQNKLLTVWFHNYNNRYNELMQKNEWMNKQMDLQNSKIDGYETNFNTIKEASFWKRLKWLFSGVKV